ncbi:uncharacterized protein LOC115033602 [Acyrthosiphon pisum]|uniref:Uncharacterized protein n=1 Tax=Acyrthosiphon pisum TaxID=7029 RepID=A0A8R2NNZ3_ACYPI|nr:uncharacterized protein LOC115033602 [Acyrthosiphon pisum]
MNRKLNLFENLDDSMSESVSNYDDYTSASQSDTRYLINMQDQESVIDLGEVSKEVLESTNEFEYIDIPTIPGYKYPIDDDNVQSISHLLNEWGLSCLYKTCLTELVDVVTLSRMIRKEIMKLAEKFPLGVQVTLRYNVEKWQKQNDSNINLASNSISLPSCSKEVLPSDLSSSFVLFDVLKCTSGAMITEYYRSHNSLNDNIRTLLVELIIQHLISNKIVMSVALAENVADQIQRIFPSELKENYFMKDQSKQPKGKIYCKYFNRIRTLKTSGLITKNTNKRQMIKSSNSNVFSPWDSNNFGKFIKINDCFFKKNVTYF